MISVVVPVYKVEKYLKRCVDSILNQTFTDFELVLVDDGSPDKCGQMCDEYAKKDNRIYVIHKKNGGLSDARNAGIEWTLKNSDSEWITFIDSDDWVHPQYIESMLEANLKNNTQVCMGGFCFTEKYTISTDGKPEDKIKCVRTEDAFKDETLDPNSACARLYKKFLFKEIRYPVGRLHEDRFTTYKVLFQYDKVSVVSYPLYYYFGNSEGITHSDWNPRKLDDIEAAENQIEFFYSKKNDEMIAYMVNEYISLIINNMRWIKNKKEFLKYEKLLRKKLRTTVIDKKAILNFTYKNNFDILKYVFPIRAKVYRRLKLLCSK